MNLDPYEFRQGDLFLFCGYRKHDYELFDMLKAKYNMVLINNPQILTKDLVDKLQPKMIFFPNWSWKVPKEIVDNYKCICYHEGDLPIGRGGSPIQNHIIRGLYEIQSTAYIMNERIDAGPILTKEPLSLKGSLDEIFERIKQNNYTMTCNIIENHLLATLQDESKAVYFERRKPSDSQIKSLYGPIDKIYDFIRMLADPYPNAFLIVDDKRILFKSAELSNEKIIVKAEIVNN